MEWLSAENLVAVATALLGIIASGVMVWYEDPASVDAVEDGTSACPYREIEYAYTHGRPRPTPWRRVS